MLLTSIKVLYVVHSRGPQEPCILIVRLQANLLGDVLLAVVDRRGRTVVGRARRQVHAGVVQQAASSSYWAVAHEGLIEPEVIQRAFVAGLLAAVVVRGVGDQLRGAELPLDPERGQVELVRRGAARRIRIDEAAVRRVRIQRPVVGNVVLLLVLIVDPGGDGPLV